MCGVNAMNLCTFCLCPSRNKIKYGKEYMQVLYEIKLLHMQNSKTPYCSCTVRENYFKQTRRYRWRTVIYAHNALSLILLGYTTNDGPGISGLRIRHTCHDMRDVVETHAAIDARQTFCCVISYWLVSKRSQWSPLCEFPKTTFCVARREIGSRRLSL